MFLVDEAVAFLVGSSSEHILRDGPSSRQLENGTVRVEIEQKQVHQRTDRERNTW